MSAVNDINTYHMLYFGRHGHKLVRLFLPILGDELCVGDTEHPRKVHAAVAFPANWGGQPGLMRPLIGRE